MQMAMELFITRSMLSEKSIQHRDILKRSSSWTRADILWWKNYTKCFVRARRCPLPVFLESEKKNPPLQCLPAMFAHWWLSSSDMQLSVFFPSSISCVFDQARWWAFRFVSCVHLCVSACAQLVPVVLQVPRQCKQRSNGEAEIKTEIKAVEGGRTFFSR